MQTRPRGARDPSGEERQCRQHMALPHLNAPALLRLVQKGASAALDLMLPPTCLGCGTAMGESHGLCVACWSTIVFLGPPACARCGLPFAYDAGDGALCAVCIGSDSAIDRLRAVFAYDDKSRGLILSFKHGDRLQGARAFGRWLARAGRPLIEPETIVVPVPLHWTRLFSRRYNQSALLSQALVREFRMVHGLAIEIAPELLDRRRRTRPQGRLGRMSRQENIRGAFKVADPAKVRGKRILLVDDVLTTGATVEECARVLKRAGAAHVDVLTLARVLRA